MYFSFSQQNKVYTPKRSATSNAKITLQRLVSLIKSDAPKELFFYRELLKKGLESGLNWKQIKEHTKAEQYKKELPYVLLSGHCEKHHNNNDLEFNGCIQIDIDFKKLHGDRIAKQLKALASSISHTVFAAISPSGHGVKILVCSDLKDKSKFKELEQQVIKYYAEKLSIKVSDIDSLSLSQPCYVPFDKSVFFNPNYSVFEFKEPKKQQQQAKKYTSFDNSLAQRAAQYLINNQINIVESYSDWISIISACINSFNSLTAYNIASDLSSISTKHNQTLFDKKFDNLLHSTSSRKATAGTLIHRAKEYGFIYSYSAGKQQEQEQEQEQPNETIIKGVKGEKLNDILKGVDTANTQIIAPTGTGKTYYVAHLEGVKIIVVPTIALCNNIEKEYSQNGAFVVRGYKHGLKELEQIKRFEDLPKLIVTTYASFRKVTAFLTPYLSKIRCFIDESHNFSSATSVSFQLKQLTDVLRECQRYKAVTLLTGTDLYNCEPFINSLQKIKISIPKKRVYCNLVNCKSVSVAAVKAIKTSIARGRMPICLFNSTNEAGQLKYLQTALKNTGVKFFNSHKKDDIDFLSITQNGIIKKGVKGIVTTTVLKEGNNINNELSYDFIIVGMQAPSTIEQLRARARNAKDVCIHVLRSNERKQDNNTFDAAKCEYFALRSAKAICDELNTTNECTTLQLINEAKARNAIQSNPVFFNSNTEKYEIDYLRLNNQIHFFETVANYRNDNLLKRSLSKYGIDIIENVQQSEQEITESEQEFLKESKAAAKQEIQKEYIATINELTTKKAPYQYVKETLSEKRNELSKTQKLVFDRYNELIKLECSSNDALNELSKQDNDKYTYIAKARFDLLKKRLTVQRIENDQSYMKSNRAFAIVLKAIRATFKEGEQYSSEQIKNKLLDCFSLDKGFDIAQLEQRNEKQILAYLRIFFDTQTKRPYSLGKRERLYKIQSTKNSISISNHNKITWTAFDVTPVCL